MKFNIKEAVYAFGNWRTYIFSDDFAECCIRDMTMLIDRTLGIRLYICECYIPLLLDLLINWFL